MSTSEAPISTPAEPPTPPTVVPERNWLFGAGMVAGFLIAGLAAIAIHAQQQVGRIRGGFDGRMEMTSAMGPERGLIGLLILVVIVLLVVWLFVRNRHWLRLNSSSAVEVVKQRFARGEITQQEYVQLLEVLRQ